MPTIPLPSISSFVYRCGIILTLCFCWIASSSGRGHPGGQVDPRTRDLDTSIKIDANRLATALTNVGSFAYDVRFGQAGLEYPTGSGKDAVFAAGIWMGAMVEGDPQPRVTVAEYAFEYAGGKLALDGTYDPNWENNPHWRVYKISRGDTPDTNPDYAEWPVADGAPVDGQGNPRQLGKQTCWAVYHDADPARHNVRAGATPPLKVEIQQTTFARDETTALRSTVFLEWKIINQSGVPIHSAYISAWADGDLGGPADDLVGCDPAQNLGYVYNGDGLDSQYLNQPPACGLQLLQGPIVPSVGGTAYVGERMIPGYRNLPANAFVRFINGTDPASAFQSYNYMRGLNADGTPIIDPTTGQPTTFMVNGDPVDGTGWVDEVPSDKRMMLTTGPFEMAPGETQTIAFAVEIGQGSDRLDSITRLRSISARAPSLFHALLSDAPGACCLPGGGCQVALESACSGIFIPETSCEPDPCSVPQGACCLLYGACMIAPAAECPGNYLGDDAACDPNPCTPAAIGACCLDYWCFLSLEENCTGTFQGVGTECGLGLCSALSWDWNPPPRWLDAVNAGLSTFFGGIGLGSEFWGSTLAREEVASTRIQFETNELSWSRCATYRRDQGYAFGGTGTFPGSAWDISDPQHPRRVNICYVEMDTPEKPANLRWDPDGSTLGGREYFFIMKSDYDGGLPYGHGQEDLSSDVMWAGWTRVRAGHQFMESTPAFLRLFIGTGQNPYGACCLAEVTCLVQTRSECSGVFMGDGSSCDPFPCVPSGVAPVDRGFSSQPILQAPIPNPTSGSVAVNFELVRPATVAVSIFTVQGALVRTLARGPAAAGSHRLTWDGRDERGHPVVRGTYYAHISADDAKASRVIVVVR